MARLADPTQSDDLRRRLTTLLRRDVMRWRSTLWSSVGKPGPFDPGEASRQAVQAFAATHMTIVQVLAAAYQRGQNKVAAEMGQPPPKKTPVGAILATAAVVAALADFNRILQDTTAAVHAVVARQSNQRGRKLYRISILPVILKAFRMRMQALATTRVSHAYNEGKIDAYVEAGIRTVGILAEGPHGVPYIPGQTSGRGLFTILTRQDKSVCQDCLRLEGRPFTLEEARALIPLHVNCRCEVVAYR